MRPTLYHEASSAFGQLGQAAVSVLITRPAGEPWYVVIDRNADDPLLYETDREDVARKMANQFATLGDLGQVAQSLLSLNKEIFLVSMLDIAQSRDGLKLIDPEMIRGSSVAQFDLDEDTLARNAHWGLWLQAMALVPELANRPKSLIYSFPHETLVKDEDGSRVDHDETYVLLEIDWGVAKPKGISIHVLDEDYVLNGEPLHKTLYAISMSPKHEVFYETPGELEWELPSLKEMPYFSQLRKPEQTNRIIAYEGGKVLESLCHTHPWLLERDAQGNVVPLRVQQVPEYLDFDEKVLRDDHHLLSSIYLTSLLEQQARTKVINQQRAQGIAMGQTVDGQTFTKVLDDGHGVVVEAAYDKSTPNTIGACDWLSYRIWAHGELVMDVRPGNKELYEARVVSISPIGGPIGRDAPLVLTDQQVGDLLATALSPVDLEEGARDARLPQRVLDFLESSLCEELAGDANDLESGEAHLVGGVIQRPQEDRDNDDAPELR